ncbi:MAG: transposase [Pirellula sp.]
MNKRRSFCREFKLAAINKVIQGGLSVSEAACDLGVPYTLIQNWRRAFLADGTLATPNHLCPAH